MVDKWQLRATRASQLPDMGLAVRGEALGVSFL